MVTFIRLIQLYRLAVGLKRFGALRALSRMPFVPVTFMWFLRVVTFFVPRRTHLPDHEGERLAAAFAGMGPAYIKLGQTLATRPDLVGKILAEGLAGLQDRLPSFPFKAARAQIEAELGGQLEDHYDDFEEEALAAASIAQVHRARTKDGRQVAVKILRPGVERRFLRDLALFHWMGMLANRYSVEARRLRLPEVVAKVRETSLKEMDLRLEAAASAELASNMEGEAGYRVANTIWTLTAKRVLTLEWISGVRFSDTEKLAAGGHDLTALSERIVRVFLRQALRDGYFHGDLHQGNLLVEPDGTIVAIDFGIMGRLGKKERRFLAETLYGFVRRDYMRVAEVHFEAGYVPSDQNIEEFAQALRAIADPIMDLPVEEISAAKLLAQLFATTERFAMQTQPELIVLQRTMMMAEGLALHLNADANLWHISRPVLEDWVRDNLSPEVRLADGLLLVRKRFNSVMHWLETGEGFGPFAQASGPHKSSQEVPEAQAAPKRQAAFWPLLAGILIGIMAAHHLG